MRLSEVTVTNCQQGCLTQVVATFVGAYKGGASDWSGEVLQVFPRTADTNVCITREPSLSFAGPPGIAIIIISLNTDCPSFIPPSLVTVDVVLP